MKYMVILVLENGISISWYLVFYHIYIWFVLSSCGRPFLQFYFCPFLEFESLRTLLYISKSYSSLFRICLSVYWKLLILLILSFCLICLAEDHSASWQGSFESFNFCTAVILSFGKALWLCG